jgi:hypothetical protein
MMINLSASNPVSYLRDEYERHQALFQAQPTLVQRFIEAQGQRLAEAITGDALQVRFSLPDRVVDRIPQTGEMAAMLVPDEMREQIVGGWIRRFQNLDLREEVRQRLSSLEQSPDQALNTSASLLRHAAAVHLVYNLLPAGRSVTYCADGDEQIPTIPVKAPGEAGSAITLETDAIVEQISAADGRGDLQVPFVPAARRFYLPQWVAFDEKGTLLVSSAAEAEAHLASMERFVKILHAASSLAPYMVADDEYQRKRYGMLGQVINQGRALAKYKTEEIIRTILERVQKGLLNRGLSVSLPYYDDQELRLAEIELEIIPAGRIMFNPIFVLRAARLEHAKVSQDTRLNASTRKHLLHELDLLEQAFINFPKQVR